MINRLLLLSAFILLKIAACKKNDNNKPPITPVTPREPTKYTITEDDAKGGNKSVRPPTWVITKRTGCY